MNKLVRDLNAKGLIMDNSWGIRMQLQIGYFILDVYKKLKKMIKETS